MCTPNLQRMLNSPEMKAAKAKADEQGTTSLNYLKNGGSLMGLMGLRDEAEKQDKRGMTIPDVGGSFSLRVRASPVSVQSFKNPLSIKGD